MMDNNLFNTHLWKDIRVVSSFVYYKESCYKHSCTSFCVNINFCFLVINAQEYNCRVYDKTRLVM